MIDTPAPSPRNAASNAAFLLSLGSAALVSLVLVVPTSASLHGLPLLMALIVARNAGFRRGLLTILVLALPVFWYAGPWYYAALVGGYIFAQGGERWHLMAAEAVTIFSIAVIALAVGMGSNVAAVADILPYATGAILSAVLADILNINLLFLHRSPWVAIRPQRAILPVVRAGTNLLIIWMLIIQLMGDKTQASWGNRQFLFTMGVTILALLFREALARTLQGSFDQLNEMIGRLGSPAPLVPPPCPIQEMEESFAALAKHGNSHAVIQDQHARFAAITGDLNRDVDLTLLQDIAFDDRTGILSYDVISLSGNREQRTLQVHVHDITQFAASAWHDEAVIEFRPAAGEDMESMLLTLHDNLGKGRWKSGVRVRLRQSRRLVEAMAKQARLIDLGSMAAAISHEVKQPLFTIAVAAENARLMLSRRDAGADLSQALVRLDRIVEQVARAREIIDHTIRYARLDDVSSQDIDVVETMQRACQFLAQSLRNAQIEVEFSIGNGEHLAIVSQIGFEQVVVNAIQNATDSILLRRAEGWSGTGRIILHVENRGARIHCSIIDNGMGLRAGVDKSAFDAFFTTKSGNGTGLGLFISRQIIAKAGGNIYLHAVETGGAALEIELRPAFRAAAQSLRPIRMENLAD